jgi:hypothetical protein
MHAKPLLKVLNLKLLLSAESAIRNKKTFSPVYENEKHSFTAYETNARGN